MKLADYQVDNINVKLETAFNNVFGTGFSFSSPTCYVNFDSEEDVNALIAESGVTFETPSHSQLLAHLFVGRALFSNPTWGALSNALAKRRTAHVTKVSKLYPEFRVKLCQIQDQLLFGEFETIEQAEKLAVQYSEDLAKARQELLKS